jgi:hypothetical protein
VGTNAAGDAVCWYLVGKFSLAIFSAGRNKLNSSSSGNELGIVLLKTAAGLALQLAGSAPHFSLRSGKIVHRLFGKDSSHRLSLLYSWSSIGSMPMMPTINLYKALVSGSVSYSTFASLFSALHTRLSFLSSVT